MIPEIKKILYATDLSENSRYAFNYAISLANRFGAGITILYVLEEATPSAESFIINMMGEKKWKELVESNKKEVLDTLKKRLENFCDDASAEVPSCPFITDEIIVKVGTPVDEILSQCEESDPDILVMGSHGHGIISNAMIGSTSRRVLRRCKKPVLIIRLPK
ncbi:universal stress protein [Thermodesulfobacteriota bacterium]